jgi:hypothetical protein
MIESKSMRKLQLVVCLLILSGALSAGEKKLMHCFTFTPIANATDADWQAFHKATDELPGKIPGLTKVWYGKLRQKLNVFNADREAQKKLASGSETATGEVRRFVREYGVCMEMADASMLKSYTDHPAHKAWEEVYSKVRQPGTTTFDLIGQ